MWFLLGSIVTAIIGCMVIKMKCSSYDSVEDKIKEELASVDNKIKDIKDDV